MVVDIDGQKYYPLHQFADMTCRSVSTIRHLMFVGNRIRTLQFREEPRGSRNYYIPVTEFTNFPFTCSGRFSNGVYHFTEDREYIQYEEHEVQKIYLMLGKEYSPKKKEN